MIYEGPYYYWTLHQTAIAAAQFPGCSPDETGLQIVQQRWKDASLGKPTGADRDLAWAKLAFAAYQMNHPQLQYEPVPA